MNVDNTQNSMWGLLNQSYSQNTNKNNDILGYNNSSATKEAQKSSSLEGVFDLFSGENSLPTLENSPQDSFEISNQLQKIQNLAARTNSSNLANLGEEMYQNGLLNQEEKMGFNLLYQMNPTFDAKTSQNIISNLNTNYANLLDNVDKKVQMMRYFGGF
ncbi:MAG: hypothetical protein J1E31_07455 [Helicobacter sp.]|nr:hypothetical protein [Helicobacter sp.]